MINWFDQGGEAYARFRPSYPDELAAYLASVAPTNNLAIDVGCGNGQLTQQLAKYFNAVVGLDPSPDQIANAIPNKRIHYQCAPAEALPLADASASLVCAAQAAHWFDLSTFYKEVRRVIEREGVIALISYGVLKLEADLENRFSKFYWDEVGPYWPAERQLVDSGYATLDFPFTEFCAPQISICLEWNLNQLLGYISTWSAVRRAMEAGQDKILISFSNEIASIWGDRNVKRSIVWPINIRIGKV